MIPPLTHLGDTPVELFMKEDWHVRPRLFRQAIAGFEPVCDLDTVAEMASDEDIESRLITQKKDGWTLEHGPFEQLPSLNKKNWTVLVQGIDHFLPEAYDLLQQFRFIPDARLDDVMLSMASDGGGVGPHYDSYDVFLLQMHGTRRWRIGPLKNKKLVEGMPLKILADFEPSEEFVLEPGDMLYLPPNYGHDGTAVGVCTTLSIGFRAATQAEVMAGLLHQAAEQIETDPSLQAALFADPKRGIQKNPAEIPADLLRFAQTMWEKATREQPALLIGMGKMLTEPKPTVYFENNTEEMTTDEIIDVFRQRGIALSMKSKLLYLDNHFFINGEYIATQHTQSTKLMQTLANAREFEPKQADAALQNEEFRYFVVGFAKAGWVETLQ